MVGLGVCCTAAVRPRLPEDGERLHILAQNYLQEKKFDLAAIFWNRLADRALANGELRTTYWARALEAGAWVQAENFSKFQESVKQAAPQSHELVEKKVSIEAWVGVAKLRSSINDIDKALDAYQKVEELLRDLQEENYLMIAWLQSRRARLLWKKGDLPQLIHSPRRSWIAEDSRRAVEIGIA